MFSGLFLYFGWTGEHWPQTADGDGEPGDWWPWEKADQEGRGHQRAERTGQSHWWPEVRLLLRNQLTSLMCRFKNFFFLFSFFFYTKGNWEPVKAQLTRRFSGISNWNPWPSTTSGEMFGRSCVAPAWESVHFFSISSTSKSMGSNYAFIDSTLLISLSIANSHLICAIFVILVSLHLFLSRLPLWKISGVLATNQATTVPKASQQQQEDLLWKGWIGRGKDKCCI